MPRRNWIALAILVVAVASTLTLAASFLPFFVNDVWEQLWGLGSWPAGTVRSFGRVGPFCGLSPWAELVAVPLASTLVVGWFTVVVGILVLSLCRGPRRT